MHVERGRTLAFQMVLAGRAGAIGGFAASARRAATWSVSGASGASASGADAGAPVAATGTGKAHAVGGCEGAAGCMVGGAAGVSSSWRRRRGRGGRAREWKKTPDRQHARVIKQQAVS